MESMVESCPNCGSEVEAEYKFCPDCGKDMSAGKRPQPEKIQHPPKKSSTKQLTWLTTMPKKTLFSIIAVVAIVVIVGAAIVVYSPFEGMTATVSGARTFSIKVTNTFESPVECHLKVGQIRYGENFEVLPGASETITIKEKELFLCQDDYSITLYATVPDSADYGYGNVYEDDTAGLVSESAEFIVSQSGSKLVVECISFY